MLLTVFLDDIVSTIASFQMVVDLGCGGRRLENVTVAVLGLDLAMGKSRNGLLCCCQGTRAAKRLERTRARGTPGLEGLEPSRFVHRTRYRSYDFQRHRRSLRRSLFSGVCMALCPTKDYSGWGAWVPCGGAEAGPSIRIGHPERGSHCESPVMITSFVLHRVLTSATEYPAGAN